MVTPVIPRRRFLITASALMLLPLGAGAQRRSRAARLGYLGVARGPLADAFLDGMRAFGYVEGKNLVIERREYEADIVSRLPGLAAEFVRLEVDVIFAVGPAAIDALSRATRS